MNVGDEKLFDGSMHQWVSCPLCGKERWVRLERGIPRSQVCRHCCSDETRAKRSKALMGHICLQETRDKISKARMGHIGYMLGRYHTEETKRRLSLLQKGRIVSESTREKLRQANLGKSPSVETREKIRQAHLGRKLSPEVKERLLQSNIGRKITEETRERLRLSHLGRRMSEKARMLLGQRSKLAWQDPAYRKRTLSLLHSPRVRQKAADGMKGHKVSLATRAKISAGLMGHGFSDETREKWLESMQKALHITPNQKEIQLLQLLNNLHPNQWAFVGDWTLVIAGKNPDFVNVNGKKQIIELFGDYWHKGADPQERIDLFSQYGYKTLIIWERELEDFPRLTRRIREFVG